MKIKVLPPSPPPQIHGIVDLEIIYFNLTLKAGSPYTAVLTGGHPGSASLLPVDREVSHCFTKQPILFLTNFR